jgi:hypothetical protein
MKLPPVQSQNLPPTAAGSRDEPYEKTTNLSGKESVFVNVRTKAAVVHFEY